MKAISTFASLLAAVAALAQTGNYQQPYQPSVPVEEQALEWGEKGQFAGRPGHDEEGHYCRGEGSIRGHCFVSSNA